MKDIISLLFCGINRFLAYVTHLLNLVAQSRNRSLPVRVIFLFISCPKSWNKPLRVWQDGPGFQNFLVRRTGLKNINLQWFLVLNLRTENAMDAVFEFCRIFLFWCNISIIIFIIILGARSSELFRSLGNISTTNWDHGLLICGTGYPLWQFYSPIAAIILAFS